MTQRNTDMSIFSDQQKNKIIQDIYQEILHGDVLHVDPKLLRHNSLGKYKMEDVEIKRKRAELLSTGLMDAKEPME